MNRKFVLYINNMLPSSINSFFLTFRKRNTELINTNKTELVGLRDSVTALEQELQKTQQASKVQWP